MTGVIGPEGAQIVMEWLDMAAPVLRCTVCGPLPVKAVTTLPASGDPGDAWADGESRQVEWELCVHAHSGLIGGGGWQVGP